MRARATFIPCIFRCKLKAHMVSKVRPFRIEQCDCHAAGLRSQSRKDEAVMYTAHYDHLGIRPDMPGDNIYNGADDNATGCGILLELAHAFSSCGAEAAALHSVCVRDRRRARTAGFRISGQASADSRRKDHARSELRRHSAARLARRSGSLRQRSAPLFIPSVQAQAKEFRLAIRPDARPEAGHYYRSDHFSLARVGIPAFSINEGVKYKGHDEAWGMQQSDEYTEKHYHQPSDEYHPDMDFTGDAVMARFGFALGWEAASMPKLVGWQKGDEFEAARAKSQP